MSRIDAGFDVWISNNNLLLLKIVNDFLDGKDHILKTFLIALHELPNYNKQKEACAPLFYKMTIVLIKNNEDDLHSRAKVIMI